MRTLYLLSVYVHIAAAIVWIGGISFLVLVVVPWMRQGGRVQAAVFLRETGARFRSVGWACFALALVTGIFNLWARGVRWGDFASPVWRGSSFGTMVLTKLSVFAVVLVVSAVHDFVVGPRATDAIAANPASARAQHLRRAASRLGRLNALLALVLLAAAIMLVRGGP